VPYYLALKAEALHLADLTSEALGTISEAEAVLEGVKNTGGVPNCIDFAVCFSRLLVQIKRKLRLRSAQQSALRRSRSRFRYRNAPNKPTQNIVAKKIANQAGVDFGYLFYNFLQPS
jgi:hypothetical protein